MLDNSLIIVGVSIVAFFVGAITYLSLPRDLEKDSSDFYMYGRKEILLRIAIVMMFGGAAGAVFGIAQVIKSRSNVQMNSLVSPVNKVA